MRCRFVQWAFVLTMIVVGIGDLAPVNAARNENGAWSVLSVVGGTKPPARKHHTMLYDPVYSRVIIYGGENASGVLPDLWVLHLNGGPQWEQVEVEGSEPPPRHGHTAVYASSQMFIFGGRSAVGQLTTESFLSDTWRLNLTSSTSTFGWDSLSAGPSTSQPVGCGDNPFLPRTHSAAAILNGSMFIMGGQSFNEPGNELLAMHDTWAENISSGGDSWTYKDGNTQLLDNMQCSLEPDRRYWHTMTAAGAYIVIFGGEYENDSNAFAWTGSGPWIHIGRAAQTFGRIFHTAIYDPISQRMLVHGGWLPGNRGGAIYDAVTSLSLQTIEEKEESQYADWEALSPCGVGPGAIAEHAAVYDSQNDRMIVFGGVTTNEILRGNDTYVLDFTDVTAPAAASLGGVRGKTTATISWTAPGDNGSSGTAAQYDLRRSTSTITEANFSSATPITTAAPQSAGSDECVEVGGLSACQTYYYALKTRDDACNWSALSNVLSLTQKCSGGEVICDGGGLGPVAVPAMPQMVEYAIRGANPTSGLTTLFVGIPSERQGESMEITIFDVTGARIRTLTRGAATVGEQEFAWDHRSHSGAAVAVGVYFARLQLGNETRTHKIVVSSGR